MWPFTRRYEVSDQTIDWLRDSFDWAIRLGLLTTRTPLVTLSKEFFTAPSSRSPDFAACLVRDIQRILGIAQAEIDVLPLDQIDARFRHDYQSLAAIGGTWQGDGNAAVIHYSRDHLDQPMTFVAILAHEVMHHVLRGLPDLPPGGAEAEELSTDLHCITMGFGLFQLAGAEAVGWSGYLRQPTRAHALAMFLRLRGLDEAKALSALPPRSAGLLRASLAWIDRHDPGLRGRLV
ncbi:MAG: hypothetical protein MUE52_13450 [Tabrizicola sp.]|jgi:hypothetical protein|nr:hypothetical protein [Tabrizicola sp.]